MKLHNIDGLQTRLIQVIERLLRFKDTDDQDILRGDTSFSLSTKWLQSIIDSNYNVEDDWLSLSVAHHFIHSQSPDEMTKIASGVHSIDNVTSVSPETTYNTGSVTKFIIVNILCRIIDEGLINVDDCICEYIDIPIPNKNTITIKNLIAHTSGLMDNINFYAAGMPISTILSSKNSISPNEKFIYSNANYVILSMIIEKICGCSLSDVLDKYICKPLNIKRTFIFNTLNSEHSYAIGYKYIQEINKLIPASNFYIWGASNVRSTPSDLIVIMKNFFKNPNYISTKSRDMVINSIRAVSFEYFDQNNELSELPVNMGYGLEKQEVRVDENTYEIFIVSGYQASNVTCLAFVPEKEIIFAIACTQTEGLPTKTLLQQQENDRCY